MIAQPQLQLMTPEEYLEWEEQQPIKYEYITPFPPEDYLFSSGLNSDRQYLRFRETK